MEALRKESNVAKADPGKAYDEMLDPDKAEIKQNNQASQSQQEHGAIGGIGGGAVGGIAFEDAVSRFSPCRDKNTNINLTSNGESSRNENMVVV